MEKKGKRKSRDGRRNKSIKSLNEIREDGETERERARLKKKIRKGLPRRDIRNHRKRRRK